MSEAEIFQFLMENANAGNAISLVMAYFLWEILGVLKGLPGERTVAWRLIFALIKHVGRRDLENKVPEKFREDFPTTERKDDA